MPALIGQLYPVLWGMGQVGVHHGLYFDPSQRPCCGRHKSERKELECEHLLEGYLASRRSLDERARK